MFVDAYDQEYPLFKRDDITFLCKPNPDAMIRNWSFFTTNGPFDLSENDQIPVSLSNVYPNLDYTQGGTQIEDLAITGTSIYEDFKYPVREGVFSHNYDIYRVFDTKAITLGSAVTMP